MIGLSGCLRGDVPTTSKVRVSLVLQREVPLSLSFRSALAAAVCAAMDVDDLRLSDVVIPADAHQLVTSDEPSHVIVSIPAPDAASADKMLERLQARFATAANTNALLCQHVSRAGGPPFAVTAPPVVE
eukprot:4663687-Prymnesium_polylepis.1